jgi:hypothetical protein
MLNLLGVKVEGVPAEFQSGKLRLHGAHERDAGAYYICDVPSYSLINYQNTGRLVECEIKRLMI